MESMEHIEEITHNGSVVAVIVRAAARASETTFLTGPDENFQVGFIVKEPGQDVPAHRHKPLERNLRGTAEVLFVREGACTLDLFGSDNSILSSHDLAVGDVVLLLSEGHGIRMTDRTVFLEVKQGPYPGVDEKDHL
jgi:mannose-6-phosphate isomerase-like protein (cupin superfamily)